MLSPSWSHGLPKPAGLLRVAMRSEEHTSELQSQSNLVCRLLLEKKKNFVTTLLSRPKKPAIPTAIRLAEPQTDPPTRRQTFGIRCVLRYESFPPLCCSHRDALQ